MARTTARGRRGRPVALALEAGRNGLLHARIEHASWLTIYPIHPATSARFRLAFAPSGAKDDAPDAEMILALLRQHRDRLTPFTPDTPAARELAALVEQRRGAVDERTGLVNRLIALLKRVYPQALSLVGEDLAAPLALAFLRRFPSLGVAKQSGALRLREFYRRHNVRSDERIEERARLVASARSITADEAILRPPRWNSRVCSTCSRRSPATSRRMTRRSRGPSPRIPRRNSSRRCPGPDQCSLGGCLLPVFHDFQHPIVIQIAQDCPVMVAPAKALFIESDSRDVLQAAAASPRSTEAAWTSCTLCQHNSRCWAACDWLRASSSKSITRVSNSTVKRELSLAHGTTTVFTPCSGQSLRGT